MSPGLLRPTADASPKSRASQLSALPLSMAVHVLVLLAVVVIPLLATDSLPLPYHPLDAWMPIVAIPTPPPPSMPASRRAPAAPVDDSRLAPASIPDGVKPETALERAEPLPTGLEPEDTGVVGNVESALALRPAVEEAPPPPPPSRIYRPGGLIRQPVRIVEVQPVYPEVAKAARVEGIVIIEAVIGTDGGVREARVLRSQPLLDDAALAAVRQWKFTPTLLNGVPVPVALVVTVRFTLQ